MLVPIDLPPGVWRNGTEAQGRGRFRDCDLVRWTDGTLRPMGGWETHSQTPVTGSARAMIAWVDNAGARWIAIGTHSGLYVMNRAGELFDVTPEGLSVGSPAAVVGGGYGFSGYGDGDFGEPGTDPAIVGDATVWSLDTFGQYLIGTNASDGKLYKWELDTGSPAIELADAPEHNRALVTTEEGFIFALGADGDPRVVRWADQQSDSAWAPDPTVQAGSFPLQTTGRLMCGKRIRGGTLLLTDQDAYLAAYQGPPLIYGFDRVGTGCGVISQGAAVVGGDALVAWMGRSGFWTYDGAARPLACEVSDYVFGDFNRTQASLVTGLYSPTFGEITWFYPSAGSSECNRYVRWNHRENHWAVGRLSRTCGAPEGVFPHPLMCGADGTVHAHETGFDYDGAEPYAETGPIEFGNGDRVFTALALIPDENSLGSVEATFHGRFNPTAEETVFGPYAPNTRTDVRFTTRQARMRLTGETGTDWRVGAFRLEVTMGGLR
jgi:hypothetical protein